MNNQLIMILDIPNLAPNKITTDYVFGYNIADLQITSIDNTFIPTTPHHIILSSLHSQLDAYRLQDHIIMNSKNKLIPKPLQSDYYYYYQSSQSNRNIPKDILHLFICQYNSRLFSGLSISNDFFTQLQSITISDNCCGGVCKFVIDCFPYLESVMIGENCFSIPMLGGVCQISNCSKLRQLEIGKGSFTLYHSFVLFNVNSLKSIHLGDFCFRYAECFALKGM